MKSMLFPATLLLSGALSAATPIDGWYSSVFGGYTYLPNHIDVYPNNATYLSNAHFDKGYNVGARFGYQSYPLRYEAELTYLHANLKQFSYLTTPQTQVSGHSSGLFGMANIYYDFPDVIPTIQPFLGLGIGYGGVEDVLKSNLPLPTYYKGSDTVFTYQATAGLTYNFSENYALNISYRYLATEVADNLGKAYQANLASIGVIYRFNEAYYQ